MFALASTSTYSKDIKRSRFIAAAGPVAGVQSARDFIAVNVAPDANHNCWAWRIGQIYRFSDDGEPSGTAGKPILQAIDGLALDMVVVIVSRWFGGVLLGSGGLIRAYGGTASACLDAAEKTRIVPSIPFDIEIAFSDLALLKARLLALAEVRFIGEQYTASGAVLSIEIAEAVVDQVVRMVADLTSGRAVMRGGGATAP